MKNKELLFAVLGGVAAGAIIGYIVTSSSRDERLEQKFMEEDYFGGLKNKYGDLLQRLNDKLESLKGEAAHTF